MGLEAWPDVADTVMAASSDAWAIYFCIFILASSLAIMNLVTGVVCEKLMGGTQHVEFDIPHPDALEEHEKLQNAFREGLKPHFELYAGSEPHAFIGLEEFHELMQRPVLVGHLADYGIALDVEPQQLFEILTMQPSDKLTFDTFASGLLRLRGSHEHLHSLMVHHDFKHSNRLLLEHLDRTQKKLTEETTERLEQVERAICPALNHLSALAKSYSDLPYDS